MLSALTKSAVVSGSKGSQLPGDHCLWFGRIICNQGCVHSLYFPKEDWAEDSISEFPWSPHKICEDPWSCMTSTTGPCSPFLTAITVMSFALPSLRVGSQMFITNCQSNSCRVLHSQLKTTLAVFTYAWLVGSLAQELDMRS